MAVRRETEQSGKARFEFGSEKAAPPLGEVGEKLDGGSRASER